MEILLILASICLILFMILATFDGFYLHIFKYGLFNHKESTFEHKTHTIRALLFPLIIGTIFLNESNEYVFFLGIIFITLDLITLAIDAWSESESRAFMGGLPRWEYVIHLFSNSFHFAAIILALAMKIRIFSGSVILNLELPASWAKDMYMFIGVNIIPGAIILAILHAILLLEGPRYIWNSYRLKITCC